MKQDFRQVWDVARIVVCVFLLAGCAAPAPSPFRSPIHERTKRLIEQELSDAQQVETLQRAVQLSIVWLSSRGAASRFPVSGISLDQVVASVRRFSEIIRDTSPPEAAKTIGEEFDMLRFSSAAGREVLFTGYFAPEFPGSLTASAKYRYPLYEPPPIPKANTRREIESKATLRGWEIIWLRDPFDAYVVHVNGSVRILLPDGSHVNIAHAATNEMPYTSIGRLLIDDNVIAKEKISLQTIRAHFRKHPDQFTRYAWRNDRYVFFELLTDDQWPRGSTGVRLTPMRSIATDHALYPAGSIAFIKMNDDSGAYPHLVINQDTGGAITGPDRVDLFVGVGAGAGKVAGGMIAQGSIGVLILKENNRE